MSHFQVNESIHALYYYFLILCYALNVLFIYLLCIFLCVQLAKLEFFKSVILHVEPFLRKYQSSKPLASFLFDDLKQVMEGLLSRFVKEKVLKESKTTKNMMDIANCSDPSHSNFKAAASIAIG